MQALLLMIVAIVLLVILAPIAIAYKLVKGFILLKFDSRWFKSIAVSIDQLGNVLLGELFTDLLLIKRKESIFGSEDETISSVIGKNYLAKNLTKTGLALRLLLHKLEKNHSVNSIEKDEQKRGF